jgi:2',3'-cyclic-nucleotide 2'-phosphodiesterase (5'-nucleotidase family)
VKDDHDQEGLQPQVSGTESRSDSPVNGVGLREAALLLAVAALLAVSGVFLVRWIQSGGQVVAQSGKGTAPANPRLARLHLFQGWDNPNPDLVFLLSGQQHGYMQPCGCTHPQRGGLVRRFNLLQNLKDRGWQVVPLDLGEVAQTSGPRELPNVQGLIKYRYSMQALQQMNYLAVGLGTSDGSLPLDKALDEFALNNDTPRVVSANLQNKNPVPGVVEVYDWATRTAGSIRVGVIAVVGPTVAEEMGKDPQVRFDKVRSVLPKLLANLDASSEKPALRVLLYGGVVEEARKLAREIPQFNVIFCLSPDDEGPAQPEAVGSTCLVNGSGHKGKNVGVLAVTRTGNPRQPYSYRYQLVQLYDDWEPAEEEMPRHPLAQLMERYTQELKSGSYLAKYGQGNHALQVAVAGVTPKFIGTARCKSCHSDAYDVWKNSKHAHAYQTLVDAKHPSMRQYDGECVVCHVTGFTYKTGYTDENTTPRLKDVGCESCHGPGSAHANDPDNPKWHALMNPWKFNPKETAAQKAIRELEIDKACQKCHDPENDMNWAFEKRWPQVIHHTPTGG